MANSTIILVPAIAGFVIQLLNLIEVSRLEPARRPNFKDWIYWLPYIIGPILGGFAGYFTFSGNEATFTPALGVQVGVSAPLILKGFANAIPPLRPNPVPTQTPA